MTKHRLIEHVFVASAVLSCVVVASACTVPTGEHDERLGRTEEGLVGGTATSARPEVGQFFNGQGGACTATLIGARAAITAAHCLSPQYTGITPAAGATFQLPGRATGFRVDYIHSFAGWRWETFSYAHNRMTTDVALLHLAETVPTSVATPATLSARPPTAGELSTTFGFGCTSRGTGSPGSGGGFKQFFSFNYGPNTTALCWGDSGGPVFFGGPTAGGALWGVNSDFGNSDDGNVNTLTDIFGSVSYFKPQIERILLAWDNYQLTDFDRPGMDYQHNFGVTSGDCAAACSADARCRSFSWNPSSFFSGASLCSLKSGQPDLVPRAGFITGIASGLELWRDRPGNDFASYLVGDDDDCRSLCARNDSCRSWTMTGYLSGERRCYLKNASPGGVFNSNCVSGVVERTQEKGWDRPGADLRWQNAPSQAACAKVCAGEPQCRAYTFTGNLTPGATNCFLKSSVPAPAQSSAMTSGVKGGLEMNTDRPGEDLYQVVIESWSSFDARLPPYDCQAACANEAQCASWTYVPSGYWHTYSDPYGIPQFKWINGTCFLKSGAASRVPAQGMISGLKGLEYQ